MSNPDFRSQSDALRNLYISERDARNVSGNTKDRFLRKAKKALKFGTKTQTNARAEEYYNQRTETAITRNVKKPKKYSTVWTPEIQDQVQMDLWDIGQHKIRLDKKDSDDGEIIVNQYGPGNNYGLFVVEVKSRKVWGRLLPTKNAEDIERALDSIFRDMQQHGRFGPPKSINGDNDFNSRILRTFFAEHGIEGNEIRISNPNQRMKNVIVERFIRTFREMVKGLDMNSFGNNFPRTFRETINRYNNRRNSTTSEAPSNVFTGEKDSMQGVPAMKRGARRNEKFTRKGIRQTWSKGHQILNPLNADGTGKTGWRIGERVRVWLRPDQLDKFTPKSNEPKWERNIYEIVSRYSDPGKQTFLIKPLIMTGLNRGTLGDYYRGKGRSPVPIRGWEMKKVTIDNEELRQWLEFKRQRDAGEIIHNPRGVRRAGAILHRRGRAAPPPRELPPRRRRAPDRLDL